MSRLDEVLENARAMRYSDVHIDSKGQVLVRNNGILEHYPVQFSGQETNAMLQDLCANRDLSLLEQRRDLDFVYVENGNRYRVNVFRQQGTLSAALRIIFEQIRSLDELSLPTSLYKLTKEPRGLVLVTGPTGSGKSTTLAAMIDEINKERHCHILTIEDPVEYLYQEKKALIHQRELGQDVDSFDTALRSALREDPDVILVGEMRDYETISSVITLAETGHLVFSTLHTIGAAKTIDRIVDVFPSHRQDQVRTQLAGVLKAVVTQTLLPRSDQTGRVPAFEIMLVNDAIANLIREDKVHQIGTMIQTGTHEGMQTLNFSLMKLVREGKISMDIAKSYSDNPKELMQYL